MENHIFSKENPSKRIEGGKSIKISRVFGYNGLNFMLRPKLHFRFEDEHGESLMRSISIYFKDSYNANVIEPKDLEVYIKDGITVSIVDEDEKKEDFSIHVEYDITY